LSTLFRLISSVFSGEEFVNAHESESIEDIYAGLEEIPYQLSNEQKQAVINAFQNDISYIQGPPGTGKSFTITTLSLLANSLGKKVLITSQKLPAVEIVQTKLRTILGNNGSLFLSNEKLKKDFTKQVISDVLDLSKSKEYDADQERILAEVEKTIAQLNKSKAQLVEVHSRLNKYYISNEDLINDIDRIENIYTESKDELDRVLTNKTNISSNKLIELVDECRRIREKANTNTSVMSLSNMLRLKTLAKVITKNLNISIDNYRKYREDFLEEMVDINKKSFSTRSLEKNIDITALSYIRKSHSLSNKKLYNWSENNENILSKKLVSQNEKRISKLLSINNYSSTLRAFIARLRWRTKRRVEAANKKVNYNFLFEIFPIVLGEIKALHPFLPFQPEIFDLVIIDEASQVNLAEILPIIYRAKRICIVGDHKQLGIESDGNFMNKFFEDLIWQKYFGGNQKYSLTLSEAKERNLLVSNSSILDLVRDESNSLLNETNSIILKEHFRSLPMLAEFTSSEFYQENTAEEGLRIMTSTPERQKLISFKNIEVLGNRSSTKKIHTAEKDKVIHLIKGIINKTKDPDLIELWQIDQLRESKSVSIGVVSFISDQVKYIEDECMKNFSISALKDINFMVGTPESFQGNERDIIILSPSIDETLTRTVPIIERPGKFNVATSRAKYFTFFVHGILPKNSKRMQRMINSMEVSSGTNQSKNLLPRGWSANEKLIQSKAELELYNDLSDYISRNGKRKLHLFNKVKTCGLIADFIIYSELYQFAILIEIDGKNSKVIPPEEIDRQISRYLTFKRGSWEVIYYNYYLRFKEGRTSAFNDLINQIDNILDKK
tara:strand:+ start:1056 stop:3575 length:2520 start_codon:yes stop_codon:yes gene_type:complete